MARIRGNMKRRIWIAAGDVVLLGLRPYEDAKADVILKYSADEARRLSKIGELPSIARVNVTSLFDGGSSEDDDFDPFCGSDSDDDLIWDESATVPLDAPELPIEAPLDDAVDVAAAFRCKSMFLPKSPASAVPKFAATGFECLGVPAPRWARERSYSRT